MLIYFDFDLNVNFYFTPFYLLMEEKNNKLKAKKNKLEQKLEKLEILNGNLQQELLITKIFLQLPSTRSDCVNKDVIAELKKRIDRKISDDMVIFPSLFI